MNFPNLPNLEAISLDISPVTCECRVWNVRHNHRVGALVTISGRYRHGSAGKDDALLIKWRLNQFHDLVRFHGLVVDCRDLDYHWGDDLCLQPSRWPLDDAPPFRLVIRPEQQDAFTYIEPEACHRFDLATALDEVHLCLKTLKR
jgi:hypothetical protein